MARESTPIHLRPHAPVAERVLLPGDPGRAMRLAIALTDQPKMLNHNRGLWGYTGIASDGEPLTVQASGMGGPSAAIVVEELADLGARRIVRVGTCAALVDGFALGEIVAAGSVFGDDGASRALGASGWAEGSLVARDVRAVRAVSTDLFYDPREDPFPESAEVVEMEAATVLAVARRRRIEAGCVLIVSDLLAGGRRERISADALEAAELELGRVAFGVLSAGRGG